MLEQLTDVFWAMAFGKFSLDDLLCALSIVDVPLSFHLIHSMLSDFLGKPFVDELIDELLLKISFARQDADRFYLSCSSNDLAQFSDEIRFISTPL
jgi:hypothetical protein